jgi:hypothetical protein
MHVVGTNVAHDKVIYAGMACTTNPTPFISGAPMLATSGAKGGPALRISKTGAFTGSFLLQITLVPDQTSPAAREPARLYVTGKFSKKTTRFAGQTIPTSVTFTGFVRGDNTNTVYCGRTTYTVKLTKK